MTQSIIVYRNPLEQQLWESGIIFPIIVFMVGSILLCVALTSIVGWCTRPMSKANDILTKIALVVGVGLPGWLAYTLLIS